MDSIFEAMTITELKDFKTHYEANEGVSNQIDGYIEVKVKAEAQAKAKADFEKAIGKLIGKLPHPDDVHNIYMKWVEVEEEDTSQDQVEVDIVNPDTHEHTSEMRYPKVMVNKWVVETNKGFTVGKGKTTGNGASKRAITVNKRDGQSLVMVGNFPSASKACEYLKIALGGDSATRVLNREGFILDAYEGTDFTTS